MKSHILIGFLVIVTWLVAMAILYERELGGRRVEAPVGAPDAPSSTWLGHRIGLVVERLDPAAIATSEATAATRAGSGGAAGEELLERTAIKPAGERPFRGACCPTSASSSSKSWRLKDD